MARLLDTAGMGAVVGKSLSYWLIDSDFVSTCGLTARSLGRLGFPRDWPNVYTSSKPLKSLIGKKGRCAGKKVGVVGLPSPEEAALVRDVVFCPLQSFCNAERVGKTTGMPVLHGYLVMEHLDQDVSAAFVAERFWWNEMPDGKWVDFTPRPEGWPEILLAEALHDSLREMSVLTVAESELAKLLLAQRFPDTESRETSPPQGANANLNGADANSNLVKRVEAGDIEAVRQLERQAKSSEEAAMQIVNDGIITPLVKLFGETANRLDAVKLLLVLTDASVARKDHSIQNRIIASNALPLLVKCLSAEDSSLQESSAAVLGNLCHESPTNQDEIAKITVFKQLVALLGSDINIAQEAAYAIWNLTVGHEENSRAVVKCGAVPKLAKLLESPSDVAQENAAGALMHMTMTEDARPQIMQTHVISSLCRLLLPSCEPEVSSQAAGALLNIAGDCPECVRAIVNEGAIGSLVYLVKEGAPSHVSTVLVPS